MQFSLPLRGRGRAEPGRAAGAPQGLDLGLTLAYTGEVGPVSTTSPAYTGEEGLPVVNTAASSSSLSSRMGMPWPLAGERPPCRAAAAAAGAAGACFEAEPRRAGGAGTCCMLAPATSAYGLQVLSTCMVSEGLKERQANTAATIFVATSMRCSMHIQ